MKNRSLVISATHIIFISDIHFGIHQNSEEWQQNQRNYFYNFFIPTIKQIKHNLGKDDKLVCINLGDTFNDRKSIDIDVNNLAIDVFEAISHEVEVIVINGNHDLSKKTNEGNTSLRSLEWLPNVTLLTNPTEITFNISPKKHINAVAIPYLGSTNNETELLVEYNNKAKYAFMHTEIASLKMDNGMTITNGANPDMFTGKIFAGHIHTRQSIKNVTYVGNPYHWSKSDVGNTKGIYVLNLKNDSLEFIENTYSPTYKIIDMTAYDNMSDIERQDMLDNSYAHVVINEEDIPKYQKKYDIYNLALGTNAMSVKPVINKKHQDVGIEVDKDYKEQSITELINDSISQLDVDDDAKERIFTLSENYLRDAELEMAQD